MGERGESEAGPPIGEVAKRLNFNTPGSGARERSRKNGSDLGTPAQTRDPLHSHHHHGGGKKKGRRRKNRKFGMGLMAALMVWVMCIACLGVMAWLNWDRLSELSTEDVSRFFSREPLLDKSQLPTNQVLRRAKLLLDILGALICSLVVGVTCAAFTCLLMFYDSDDPGHFPPTPVSPRRQGEEELSNTGWHLGYIFAPVNFFVGFSLALLYLRLSMGLPLYPQV